MQDIVACLQNRAASAGESPLYDFLDSDGRVVDRYTALGFHRRSNFVAARLAETGTVRFGHPVLLAYEPGLEVLVAFFACVKLGALPVPVPPLTATGFRGSMRKLSLIAADAGARTVLAGRRCMEQIRSLTANRPAETGHAADAPVTSLDWIQTNDFQGELSEFAPHINPVMFLQYTSGSTENPRGVVVSHRNVIHNGRAICPRREVGVTWLPHYHDMGMIGYYLNAVLTGGRLVAFSDYSFMRRPLLWLETITKYRGTITSAPNFAYDVVLREDVVSEKDLHSLDLRSMRCVMNASEPVRWETMSRFAARFACCGLKCEAVTASYGLAEAPLAVSSGGRRRISANTSLLRQGMLQIESGPAPQGESTDLASCGRPLDGIEVRIVDPNNRRPLGDNAIGEVWLRGASKAHGYWSKPELSKASFEATLVNGQVSKRYLRTGDLGFLHEGELFICGRLKDMMIFRGKNYFPHDVENVIQRQIPSNRPGTVAAFSIECENGEDALAIVVEIKPHRKLPDAEQICDAVRRETRLELEVFAAVKPGSIARTSSGKIARRECRRRWLAGEMDVLACYRRAPGNELKHVLDDVSELLQMPGIDQMTLIDVGVDSLALVSLSLFIKRYQESRGLIDSDEISDLKLLQTIRVGELKRLIDAYQMSQLPEATRAIYSARRRSIEREETALMREDARLAADIRPHPADSSGPNGTVVLTGATGFFGGFLLDSLLRLSDSRIAVVVRSRDVRDARRRVEAALRRTAPRDAEPTGVLDGRVSVYCGDLAQPRLGLGEDCWNRLRDESSAVYHCGASVAYVRPYQALRGANVYGTQEALRLACDGRCKSFHLVSTTFIFGWSAPPVLLESDCNPEMQDLDFGYAQTKWVAEQLVFDAAKRGVPVRIYRPSLLTAALSGHYVRHDITARILSYMIRYRIAVNVDNQVSLLPADVAADNLIALSRLDQQSVVTTYHLTTDGYYSMPSVTGVISSCFGYEFRYVGVEDFIEHVNRYCTQGDLLFPLIPFINTNFRRLERMRHKRYDNSQYRAGRERSALASPEPPLDVTVGAIVKLLQRERLVP